MTDNESARPRFRVDGYELRRLLTDPWHRSMAYLCTRCGAWVGDTDTHDKDHAEAGRQFRAALATLAAEMRASRRRPGMDQEAGDYYASAAVHGLADALDKVARQ